MKVKKCNICSIAASRKNRVIGRGNVPADILFLGEAPGKAEDLIGVPFVGPSGNLLERLIDDSTKMAKLKGTPSYYITNIILCRPYIEDVEDDKYLENREPTLMEIVNCSPLVNDIIKHVNPKFVVFVGKVAESFYQKNFKFKIRILHPSFLLRNGGISSPHYLSTVRTLSETFNFVVKNW